MDKKEFSQKVSQLQQQIDEYKRKIKELDGEIVRVKNEYISENAPYPIGTKLRIVYCDKQGGCDEGIVTRYDTMYHGNITPTLCVPKKNGEANLRRVVYWESWREYKIEVINN